jgi:hypothetical protein
MRLMAGLYGSGRSSPDVEMGRRLSCKLSEEETGRRQGMHEPNAIWAVSVHEKGVVILAGELVGSGGKGPLQVITTTARQTTAATPNWDGTPPTQARICLSAFYFHGL